MRASNPRLQTKLQWRDLVAVSRAQVAVEVTLPLPWLSAALLCGAFELWSLVVLSTFAMFMTGLRVTHNAFHNTVGIGREVGDWLMFGLSVLLGGAMHAIEYTHLQHHRDCFGANDIEGKIASMPFRRALLHSPKYPLLIHLAALRGGSARQKRWIVRELVAVALLQILIWLVLDIHGLQVMSLALLFANLSAPMVGIWAVHQACEHQQFIARTSRSKLLNTLVYGMFYHLEHHLYPGVPTCHLPILAQRLDLAADCRIPTLQRPMLSKNKNNQKSPRQCFREMQKLFRRWRAHQNQHAKKNPSISRGLEVALVKQA
jgi:fatty acid desaturase